MGIITYSCAGVAGGHSVVNGTIGGGKNELERLGSDVVVGGLRTGSSYERGYGRGDPHSDKMLVNFESD